MNTIDNWHEGSGEAYFRCLLCSRPVSASILHTIGECPHCGGKRVKPTNLTLWEKVKEIFCRPSLLAGLWR